MQTVNRVSVGKIDFPGHQICVSITGKFNFSSLIAHFKYGDFLLFLLRYEGKSICKVRYLV